MVGWQDNGKLFKASGSQQGGPINGEAGGDKLRESLKRGSMVKGLANYLWGNLNYGAENIPGANVHKVRG